MRKKAFTVTAFFAASYIIASSIFNIISSFTDGSVIYNLKSLYRTLYDLRPLFLIFFGLSILFMILAKAKNELSSAYKMATGICLLLAIPDIFYSITNMISTVSPLQAIKNGNVNLSNIYLTNENVYTSIVPIVFSFLLSVLIIMHCVFSLFNIKKYKIILSIAAVLFGVVSLIYSLYFYLQFYIMSNSGNISLVYIFSSFLTIASQTIMLLYSFRKEEEDGITINRQIGFILASIITVLICIEGDYAQTMTYVYIAFPIFVYCLVNVVTDLLIGKKYKNENNSIVYTKEIKTIICALSLIINSIIVAFINTQLPRDWGGLAILPIMGVYFISNIVFTCAMRLGFLRNALLAVISIILPYITFGITEYIVKVLQSYTL